MADHVRTQCRDAVVTLLTGLTTTTTHVTAGRPESRKLQSTDLPHLLIYTNETEAEATTMGQGSARMVEVCQLMVDGIAQGTGDVDKTLDTIEKEVRAAIAASPTLSGKAKEVLFSSSAKEQDDENEQPTWRIRMTFTLQYHTRESAPDVALA